jgi:hypothetical protein
VPLRQLTVLRALRRYAFEEAGYNQAHTSRVDSDLTTLIDFFSGVTAKKASDEMNWNDKQWIPLLKKCGFPENIEFEYI